MSAVKESHLAADHYERLLEDAQAQAEYGRFGGQAAPTLCSDCDNVEAGSRKTNPRNWLCRMHKRRHAEGFISPTYWAENEPFLRCVNVNAGSCPLFTPLRKLAGGDHDN